MKILTYYENINFRHQDELISLWQQSWSAHGFECVILSEADAKKSYYYEEFAAKVNRLHEEIAGKPLTPYGLSCWLRWLAYSTQGDEKFYVSDYDLINHHFETREPSEVLHYHHFEPHQEPSEVLHLMDDCCPCFASGRPSQFLDLCKQFIEVSEQNKAFFVEAYRQSKFIHFHDQEFFVIRYNIQKTDKNKDIKLTRSREFISVPQLGHFWERPLVHYSHNVCHSYCMKNNIEFNEAQRCNIIKEHLIK